MVVVCVSKMNEWIYTDSAKRDRLLLVCMFLAFVTQLWEMMVSRKYKHTSSSQTQVYDTDQRTA